MTTGSGARIPWEVTEGKLGRGAELWPNLAFKHKTWNTGWMQELAGRSNLYATGPTLCKILKGPKNLGDSLWEAR